MMKSAVIFMRFCRAFEKGSSWNNTKRQKKRNNYVVVKRKEKQARPNGEVGNYYTMYSKS